MDEPASAAHAMVSAPASTARDAFKPPIDRMAINARPCSEEACSAAGDPGLCLVQLGEREHAHFARDHPREELCCPYHPVDVGDNRRAHPRVPVPDAEIKPKPRIGPQRGGLNLVECLDHVQRPEWPSRERPLELRAEHIVVVLTLDFTPHTEARRPRRHVGQSLDHCRLMLRLRVRAWPRGKGLTQSTPGAIWQHAMRTLIPVRR